MAGFSIVSAPASEPVTLEEAKLHLRVDSHDEDSYIESLVVAARELSEEHLRRAIITQTLELSLDGFPCYGDDPICLPRNPVQSISSITYVDTDGVTQTLDASKYVLDNKSYIARVLPAYGETWPSTRAVPNSVTVKFVAGYGGASSVPAPIKHAIKLTIGTYFDVVRENVVVGTGAVELPQAAKALLGPYRVLTAPGDIA